MEIKNYLKITLSYLFSKEKNKAKIDFSFKNIKFLLSYMKKQKKKFFQTSILLFVISLLALPSPAIIGYIVDTVFIEKRLYKLSFLALLLIIILLLSEFCRTIQEYQKKRLTQEINLSIQHDLINKILKFPMSLYNNVKTGYLVSRIDEVSYIGVFFTGIFFSLLENFIKLIGSLFIIATFNLKLTLISLLILPLLFEVSRRYRHGLHASSFDLMEADAKLRGKIQETFSGIEIIKAFSKELQEANKIKDNLKKVMDKEIIQSLFSTTSGRILGLISGINMIVILWVSGYEIFQGRLTVGQYIAFVAYIGYLHGPIQLFASIYLSFQTTLVACKRISEFLLKLTEDEDPRRTHKFKKLDGYIEFKNVSHDYGEDNDVLRNVSFFVNKEEKVAFVGKSGSGKSTIVNLIMGFYEPSKGNIYIDSQECRNINLNSLRNKIGLVSQNIFLFNDSILNNIRYSCQDASIEDVIKAAKLSGAHKFISQLPKGYDTHAGELGKKLSGGEKQRISIARSILKHPEIVIFDEPTAHLDSITANSIIDSIQKVFKDKTCIIISHFLKNIDWVDRIIVLKEGKILQEGAHDILVKRIGHYRELFGITGDTCPQFRT